MKIKSGHAQRLRFSPALLLWLLVLLSSYTWAEPLSKQRQDQLINMVKHDCGSCHGLTLKGGLGPPLTTDALRDKPHGLLFNAIMLGRDNTAMPPWQDLLTQQEIDWLVVLLKSGTEKVSGNDDE